MTLAEKIELGLAIAVAVAALLLGLWRAAYCVGQKQTETTASIAQVNLRLDAMEASYHSEQNSQWELIREQAKTLHEHENRLGDHGEQLARLGPGKS